MNCAELIGEASTEVEFLRLLTLSKPDILLIDVDMPELNGMDVVKKTLKAFPGITVYAFTMFGDDEYIIKLTEIGVKGFILKSSAIFELDKDIHSLLRDVNCSINNQIVNILNKSTINRFYISKEHKRISRRVKKPDRGKSYAAKTRKRILVFNGVLF